MPLSRGTRPQPFPGPAGLRDAPLSRRPAGVPGLVHEDFAMNTTVAPPLADGLLARRARLGAGPGAAAEARARIRDAIADWGLPVDAGDALLLTSELVANAVVHGGGGAVTLSVRVAGGRLRVDVHDTSGDLPAPAGDPGAGAVSGRGLMLVEALAEEWGSYRCPGGKAVFFTLAPSGDAR